MKSYLFGGDTGLTYEDLKRRQLYADQMMLSGAGGSAPKTAMEGANRAASSIMGALLAKRLGREEERGRSEYEQRRDRSLANVFGGYGSSASGGAAPYVAPRTVPQLDRSNPEAIATDAMSAIGKPVAPQAIREGLIARGLPEHVADGFLMNFRDESGFNPGINERNPTVPGSRGGFGLYQLTGPRRRAYEAYAAERGVDPSDVNAQLDFLVAELQGPEANAARQIFSAKDPGSAAAAIATHFLRPAEEHLNRRVASYTGGQEYQTAQAGGINPELLSLMSDDYASPGDKAVLGMLLQRQLEQSDPMRRMELEHMQLKNEALRNPRPEPTSMQRNYEFLIAQGIPQEQALEMVRGGSSVTVNNGGMPVEPLGTEGQILVADPSAPGGYRVEIAANSKLAQERAEAERQRQDATRTQAENEMTRTNVVTDTTRQIRGMMDNGGVLDLPEVGVIGSRLGGINQEAADMGGMLDTLKGMVVFDRLEKLRQASATGASGLGQVTEREIALLGAQLGALDQRLSADRIRDTLDTIDEVFGKLSPQAQAYITGQSDELGGGGAAAPGATPRTTPAETETFDAFAASPSIQEAARKYGVTVEEMWEIKQGRD